MNCQNNTIGIIGGSFNPIHFGHLFLAKEAYRQFAIPKVLVMPAGVPYLKKNLKMANKEDRCNMVKLAIKPYDFMELSTIEVDRVGNTYTAETLKVLRKSYDKIYFILGADSLFSIDTWKNPEFIMTNCILLAANRGNYSQKDINDRIQYLNKTFTAQIHLIDMKDCPISSTQVREAIKTNNIQEITKLIPADVYDYILENHIYQLI